MNREEFQKTYFDAMRGEIERYNSKKLECANQSRYMIGFGMVLGALGSHSIISFLEKNHVWLKSLTGKGLIIGCKFYHNFKLILAVASMSGYFLSKVMYTSCVDTFVLNMRQNARRRHEHYFKELTGVEAWKDNEF